MSIILVNSSQTVKQGDHIQLLNGKHYQSEFSKTPKGRWYYEVDHLNGSRFFVIGFIFDNNDEITLAPRGDQYPSIYSSGKNIQINSADKLYEKISFPIPTNSTIGFGINIEQKLFSVFYNKTSFSFHYQLNTKPHSLNIIIREASKNIVEDYCIINLGEFKFKNDVPYGYFAWQEPFRINSCKSKSYVSHLYMLIVIIQ